MTQKRAFVNVEENGTWVGRVIAAIQSQAGFSLKIYGVGGSVVKELSLLNPQIEIPRGGKITSGQLSYYLLKITSGKELLLLGFLDKGTREDWGKFLSANPSNKTENLEIGQTQEKEPKFSQKILNACQRNDVSELENLLSISPDASWVDPKTNKTALIVATELGYNKIVQILVNTAKRDLTRSLLNAFHTIPANGETALVVAEKKAFDPCQQNKQQYHAIREMIFDYMTLLPPVDGTWLTALRGPTLDEDSSDIGEFYFVPAMELVSNQIGFKNKVKKVEKNTHNNRLNSEYIFKAYPNADFCYMKIIGNLCVAFAIGKITEENDVVESFLSAVMAFKSHGQSLMTPLLDGSVFCQQGYSFKTLIVRLEAIDDSGVVKFYKKLGMLEDKSRKPSQKNLIPFIFTKLA